jgi:serine/threonine-protein kinase
MSTRLDENYVLGDVLGRGGMGIVYSATQRSLERRVAVKIPHPELAADPVVHQRFRTEALAGAKLTHRNIARVIDFGAGEPPYIVMEHVAGIPLDKLVSDAGAMETRIASDVSRQILAALHEAHCAGIIHADIKTGNVLVETLPDGELHARVIDFGLAHFTNQESSFDGRVLSGTPDYLAPELVQGEAPSVASDIYSVGVVLYELLTGTTPFNGGSSAEIMSRQVDDRVVPPSLRCPDHRIPDGVEDAVMRALAKDPKARFATANEFSDALRDATAVPDPIPWIAPGTAPAAVLSPEATTASWQRDRIVQVFAPAPIETGRVSRGRLAANVAVAAGDGDMVVTAYLELAGRLIDEKQLAAAATELEHGLALLRPNATLLKKTTAIWRLQLCLAALYSGLGDPARARSAARLGQDDAVRAGSRLGQGRASALLARLARGAGPSP